MGGRLPITVSSSHLFTAIFNAIMTCITEHSDSMVCFSLGGRALGGSSAINLFSYGRGSKSVFDLWESLGNPGWGWDSVFPLFKKASSLNPAERGQRVVEGTCILTNIQ